MASGGQRFVRGSFLAPGSALSIKTPEKPVKVELINVSDPAVGYHHDHMPDASVLVVTDTCANVTSNGVTLQSLEDGDGFTGFIVGTDGNFNTSGEQVYWTAWY